MNYRLTHGNINFNLNRSNWNLNFNCLFWSMHVIEQFNGGVYETIIVFVEKIMDQHYSDVLNDFKLPNKQRNI